MKKAILIGLFGMIALLITNLTSAVVPNVAPYANGIAYGYASYGSYPVNPSLTGMYNQYSYPARAGGFFGANSAFLIGLRPGVYDGPIMNSYTRNAISSAYYPRAGGYFGYGGMYGAGNAGYYYNLRPGTFVYNGAGTNFANVDYRFHGTL
jgi:hypothetical protein